MRPCVTKHCWYCRSAPVIATSAPLFDTSALIELPGGAMADPSTLLSHRQPLHLVVLHSQPAAALLNHATVTNTARMSTSPSASINIAQQHNIWGHSPGASPPGMGSAITHGQSSSCSTTGSSPGTALRPTPNANPAYFLTATSGQGSHQQGPGPPAAAALQSGELLRMSSKTGVVGSCYIDWRLALTHRGDTNRHNMQLTCSTQAEPAGMVLVELEVRLSTSSVSRLHQCHMVLPACAAVLLSYMDAWFTIMLPYCR